ncbi:hypothetical protein LTR16_009836, partial [Cryomyces antarcticus]
DIRMHRSGIWNSKIGHRNCWCWNLQTRSDHEVVDTSGHVRYHRGVRPRRSRSHHGKHESASGRTLHPVQRLLAPRLWAVCRPYGPGGWVCDWRCWRH